MLVLVIAPFVVLFIGLILFGFGIAAVVNREDGLEFIGAFVAVVGICFIVAGAIVASDNGRGYSTAASRLRQGEIYQVAVQPTEDNLVVLRKDKEFALIKLEKEAFPKGAVQVIYTARGEFFPILPKKEGPKLGFGLPPAEVPGTPSAPSAATGTVSQNQ